MIYYWSCASPCRRGASMPVSPTWARWSGTNVTRPATDTVWSLNLQGFVTTGYMLLIKTSDGKVLELEPYDLKTTHVTDSVAHSPVTGEIMEFYHYEHVLYYHITTTALNYIAEHGISKLRCGYDNLYRDKEFRRNEFGNDLTEAYKKVLEHMSPDYVPPKKPSIRDGF